MKINKFFFKDNNNFIYQKKFRKFIILDKKYDVEFSYSLISALDYRLETSKGPFFKSKEGDTTTIGVVNLREKKVVVKRYNIKGFWHRLKKCCFRSRALHSWLNIYKLQKLGIPTLMPIAIIENRFGPFCGKAYVLTEYNENSINAHDYFDEKAINKEQWKIVVHRITEIIVKLKHAFLRHHDLQCGNMIIVKNRPLLLDLDHMQQYPGKTIFFRKSFQKDVHHFLDFAKPHHTAYLMFLEEFRKNQLC